jgi:hypothetical protein
MVSAFQVSMLGELLWLELCTSARPEDAASTGLFDTFYRLMLRCRVLESLKAGIRLPEARFANLKLAAKGQHSVYGLFKPVPRDRSSEEDAGDGNAV